MVCKFVNNALLHDEMLSKIRTRQDGHWESAAVVGKSIEKVNLLNVGVDRNGFETPPRLPSSSDCGNKARSNEWKSFPGSCLLPRLTVCAK